MRANDRTVHAFGPDLEVVRYDRAGKWYIEPKDKTLPRQAVTIAEAVNMALWLRDDNGTLRLGQQGGARFDAMVRVRCTP